MRKRERGRKGGMEGGREGVEEVWKRVIKREKKKNRKRDIEKIIISYCHIHRFFSCDRLCGQIEDITEGIWENINLLT